MVRAGSSSKERVLKIISGDHIFGLAPLMAGCLNGAGGTMDGFEDPRENLPEDLDVSLAYLFFYHV